MAKKKETVQPVLEVVKDFDGTAEQPNLGKPTAEQVEQYKLDFDNAIADFTESRFVVSEPGSFKANELAMWLTNFLKKYAMWSKTGWMGVIKMEEELRKCMSMDNEKGLSFDYQTLEFCGYMLMNPGGVGYDSALEFEAMADEYSKIMMVVGEKVEEARAQLQGVQYLQEKWAAGEQGFFLADLEPKEQPKEECECDCEGDDCDKAEDTPENPGIVIDATKKD